MRSFFSGLSNRNKFLLSAAVAAVGIVCLLCALISVFRLSEGGVEAKLVLALMTGALIMLSLALMRREGCDAATLMLALLPLGAAFYLRILCMDYISPDYELVLAPWVDFFRDNGFFAAIREPIGNYSTPYLYLLAMFSMLPLPTVYLLKLCVMLFDLLLAWGGMRIVRVFRPQSRLPEVTFLLLFLLPTVVLNGVLWGYDESMMASLMLLSLASVLENHPLRSVAFSALAFCFNPQAVYVLPVLAVVWFVQRVRLNHLLVFPVTVLAVMLPALLMGKPLGDILGVVYRQMKLDAAFLSLNAPSLFALLPQPEGGSLFLTVLGIALALSAALAILLLCFRLRRRLRDQELILLALMFAMALPFLLPHTHERYFFLAAALSVVTACADLRRLPTAALCQLAVVGGYHASLMGKPVFPMWLGALMILLAIFLLAEDYLPWDLGGRIAGLFRGARRRERPASEGAPSRGEQREQEAGGKKTGKILK